MPVKKKVAKVATKKGKLPRPVNFKKYKDAITKSGGFITKAAELLGVTHQAVSKYIKAHPELQELIYSINESYLDFAESQLLTLIKEKNNAAIFFYLKCKGKGRGYIERAEYDIKTPGDPVKVMLDDVGKRIESNPKLKAKLEKETED